MPISDFDLLVRLLTAVVLGASIGFERERRGQPAGLRTHLLVALGAATFMLISAHFAFFQHYPREVLDRVDGSRIASNVVVGIGFLGGGAILHSTARVRGLTTAASLWLVAAVGLASGAGMYLLAVSTALMTLFALSVLLMLETQTKEVVKFRVRLELEGDFLSRETLKEHLRPIGVKVSDSELSRNLKSNRTTMTVDVEIAHMGLEESMMKRFESLPQVRKIRLRKLD